MLVRQKWHTERRNFQEGDVVLIQDSNLVRGNCKLGQVSKMFPSQDGKVRKVQVRYKIPKPEEPNKRYSGSNFVMVQRPVQRLVVREIVE